MQNIGEDVDGLGHIGVEGLGVINSVFPLNHTIRTITKKEKKTQSVGNSGSSYRGVGVQVTTHVLNFQLKLALSALVGALEGQVFQEVSGSIGLVGFGTGSGVDVNAYRAGSSVRVVFGGDGETIRQLFNR